MAANGVSRKRSREEDESDLTPLIRGAGFPMLKVNPVKEKLRRGEIVIAGSIKSTCTDSAIVMASNFDFLWIEMEHSPITLETVRSIISATRGMRALPFVRVPGQERWMAKRVLDIGALGVIFPFCSTVELAQQCTRACRYPPTGNRGCGPNLSQLTWGFTETGQSNYYDWAQENIMCVIMIEEKEAAENVEAIAATPGIDVLFVGTSDLSYSLTGRKSNKDPSLLMVALEKVLAAGKKFGIPCGLPVANAEQLKTYKDMGFTFFQCQDELTLLQQGCTNFTETLRNGGLVGAIPNGGKGAANPSEASVC